MNKKIKKLTRKITQKYNKKEAMKQILSIFLCSLFISSPTIAEEQHPAQTSAVFSGFTPIENIPKCEVKILKREGIDIYQVQYFYTNGNCRKMRLRNSSSVGCAIFNLPHFLIQV